MHSRHSIGSVKGVAKRVVPGSRQEYAVPRRALTLEKARTLNESGIGCVSLAPMAFRTVRGCSRRGNAPTARPPLLRNPPRRSQ
jgi:hypothetical protein